MSVNHGHHRTVVGSHYGMRDWLSQRITSVLMALFTVLVLLRVVFSQGEIGYELWSGVFTPQWMKCLTFVALVSMLHHAWVGMRNVLMDYAKPYAVRLVLHVFVIVWIVACFGWAVQVLWRV